MIISECIPARAVLWIVMLIGFAINYMVRININMAIVSMVRERSTNLTTDVTAECSSQVEINNITSLLTFKYDTTQELQEFPVEEGVKFDWNEQEQNLVLGAFYWTLWITQLPGGVLGQRYGTKLVFGLAQLVSILLNFLVPMCGQWGFQGIFIIRLLQGAFAGFTWPSMHPIIGKWVPPDERSKFVSAYFGSSLGAALAYPLYAMLIAVYGWESVFYSTGIVGTLWCLAWWYLVYDTPQSHPRISEKELQYIEKSLGDTVQTTTKLQTPWLSIFTSPPVWVCTITQFGAMWGLFTLLTQAPTFFRFIHGFGIQMTGILSGIPHLSRVIFSLLFSVFADCLLDKRVLGSTAVRKLATFFGVVVSGFTMLGLAFTGCNSMAAVVLLAISTTLNGAISSGVVSSTVDLSPNFSGVIFGLVSTIGVVPGFVSPVVVGYLTNANQTISQWKIVYLIGAAIQISTGFLFIFCGSSVLQPWNNPPPSSQTQGIDLPSLTLNRKKDVDTTLTEDFKF